jgi:predicted permease
VLLFTLVASIVTGLVFGSIPAFARRIDVAPALREARTTQSSRGLRSALIVAQISASFMLLIAAGLMLRSLMKVQNVDPGFRTDNLLSFRADMSWDKFPLSMPPAERRPKIAEYWRTFEARLRAIPGVTEVGGSGTFPLNENDPFPGGLVRESHPLPPGVQAPQVSYRFASPDYFRTLRQPIVAGRAFTDSDTFTSTRVAIVNQAAAKLLWPSEDPIGTRVSPSNGNRPVPPAMFRTIVGVVADVRQQLDRAPTAEVYVPIQQNSLFGTMWVVRTLGPPEQTIADIKAAARVHDRDLPVASFRTMAEVRSTGLTPRRVVVALIGLFGLLALVITAAGIAGVVAFSVNQRTQEFGIRMALGAQRGRVLSLVLREGLVLVAIGLVIGLAGASVLTKFLGAMLVAQSNGPLLVDVPPTDALTYASVAAVLVIVAIVACLLPARRAASVDPMIALRAQ